MNEEEIDRVVEDIMESPFMNKVLDVTSRVMIQYCFLKPVDYVLSASAQESFIAMWMKNVSWKMFYLFFIIGLVWLIFDIDCLPYLKLLTLWVFRFVGFRFILWFILLLVKIVETWYGILLMEIL